MPILEHEPLGNTDTIVERLLPFDDTALPATIDIELVALSLMSVAPVNIGGSFFDIFVTIDTDLLFGGTTLLLPRSLGMMTINPGGAFTSFFDIFVEIELSPVGGDASIFVLDQLHIDGGGTWALDSHGGFVALTGQHSGPHPQVVVARVPEPSALLMLGTALAGLARLRLRRRKA